MIDILQCVAIVVLTLNVFVMSLDVVKLYKYILKYDQALLKYARDTKEAINKNE